ncbi:MAG: DUF4129 domain-containing protein, partial [bacterium]
PQEWREFVLGNLLYLAAALFAGVTTALVLHFAAGWGWGLATIFACFLAFALAAVTRGLHPLFQDLTSGLTLKEQFLAFLVHLAIFMVPWLLGGPSELVWGLSALNVALLLGIIRASGFNRLLANNLLIFVLLLYYRAPIPIVGVLLWASLFVFCLTLENYYFKYAAYQQPGGWLTLRELLVSAGYYSMVATIVAGLGSWLLGLYAQPIELPRWFRHSAPMPEPRPTVGEEFSTGDLAWLLIYTAVLVVSLVVCIFFLNWLRNKLMRKRPVEIETHDAVVELEKISDEEDLLFDRRPLPPGWRGQILLAYDRWCERLAALALVRRPEMTPAEYAADLVARASLPASDLEVLTHLFERAKYGTHKMTKSDFQTAERTAKKLEKQATSQAGRKD